MIHHIDLGQSPFERSRNLRSLIAGGQISFAGNCKLRIYGTLQCSSGKKMKANNRMFFTDKHEAEKYGYRPCGHCMRKAYLLWQVKLSG
jgi:methylphosphotriester-DNA--protein-cysteine methyltransferase